MDLQKARAALDNALAALTVVEAALEADTPLTPAESAALLTRVASIVVRVRNCSTYCGQELTEDLERLEGALKGIEDTHAATIDHFQDGLYRAHNVQHFQPDAVPDPTCGRTEVEEPQPHIPGEVSGRWGRWGSKKRDG